MAYIYATAFGKVGQTLTADQKVKLASLRKIDPTEPKGPFLYSDPIQNPTIGNTDFLLSAQ